MGTAELRERVRREALEKAMDTVAAEYKALPILVKAQGKGYFEALHMVLALLIVSEAS